MSLPDMALCLLAAVACAITAAIAAPSSPQRSPAAKFPPIVLDPCWAAGGGWANCDKKSPDCETNTRTNRKHCGWCGNACANGYTCVSSGCYRSMCPSDGGFPSNSNFKKCPVGTTCKLGNCVHAAIPCGGVMSGYGPDPATKWYIVNIGDCDVTPPSTDHFMFWYNAFDVPVQFQVRIVANGGPGIYGPVVVGSGNHRCANGNKCPGNPFGAKCPIAEPWTMSPNVPIGSPAGKRLPRPTGDIRVLVGVTAPCKDSKWEFMVGCTLPTVFCVPK